MQTNASAEQRIRQALNQMQAEARLPMEPGQLVEELMRQTNLARSTVYRLQRQWRQYVRARRTTLDDELEQASGDQRFLISIRMPAELLRWLKEQGEAHDTGYQSLIVSLLYWCKQNPLLADHPWHREDDEDEE
jgi:hypothetical protein